MFEFKVGCFEFLRLTGAELGSYGLYIVSETGIVASLSESELLQFESNWGKNRRVIASLPESERSRLGIEPGKSEGFYEDEAFIRSARLDFPTTAPKLVEWQRKNDDFQLPEWFISATSASTEQEAAAFLDQADSELRPCAEAWKARLRITPSKMDKNESGRKGGQTANKLNREQKDEMLDHYRKNLVDLNNKDTAAHTLKLKFPGSNAKESTIRNWLKKELP